MYKVIGIQGQSRYLIVESGAEMGATTSCQILDLNQHKLFPPNKVGSVLARGYWEEFTGDQEPVLLEAKKLGLAS